MGDVMGLALEWPLVGRLDVLAAFRPLVASAEPAAAPGGLVLVGAAGVGKTRAAMECLALAAAAGWRTARIAGSRAASSIPFGAASPLLPPIGDSAGDRAEILRRARAALRGGPGEHPVCVVVDDAHLLDDASATLVQQLAMTASAVLVVTARSDVPIPDPVVSLWRDGVLPRLELGALDRDEHDRLVGAALGNSADDVAAQRLFAATDGNPLLLRELLLAAEGDNALFADGHGGWRLARFPKPSARLAELVTTRIGALGDDERRCLELIAIGEPLSLEIVASMGLGRIVETLERRRIVRSVVVGQRIDLVVAHALYAEVARDRLPALRARNLRRQLADVVEASSSGRTDDSLRIATWRLDAGIASSASSLLLAARQALMAADVDLARRLALAVYEDLGRTSGASGVKPQQLLAEEMDGLGRVLYRCRCADQAEAVLAAVADGAGTAGAPVRAIVTRASNMFWGLQRRSDAVEMLQTAATGATGGSRARIELEVASLDLARGGSASVALAIAMPLEAHADPRVSRAAARLAVGCLIVLGRYDEARAVISAVKHDGALPDLFDVLDAFILVEAGSSDSGTAAAELLHATAVNVGTEELRAACSIVLARARLAGGDGEGARALAAAAIAMFSRRGGPWPVALCVATLASAEVLRGDLVAAHRALERVTVPSDALVESPDAAPGRADLIDPLVRDLAFGAEVERALAHLLAIDGAGDAAESVLRARADACDAAGMAAEALGCLHDLVRLDVVTTLDVERMRRLASRVDGPAAQLRARHAAAHATGDGTSLAAVAADLEAAGLAVLAYEAATSAAIFLADADADRAAAVERRRAIRLRAGFPRALLLADHAPIATTGDRAPALRPGEAQVAALAAAGRSDREIAAELHLSVRTVGNYLLRAYRSLGIRGRDGLAAALDELRVGLP